MATARAKASARGKRSGEATIIPNQEGLHSIEEDEGMTQWLKRVTLRALWTPYNYWTIAGLLLVMDLMLTMMIILSIRFTEIDFQTYMQQVAIFLKGERKYDQITGDTGPCVYPALHLYIFTLFKVISDEGKNLRPAQITYGVLYLFTQLSTMAIYKQARIPPILLFPLILSKRLHSIYVLRLFNDCWSVALMYAAIWAMCKAKWGLASTLYSLALGVKMNILLYAPAMAAIYLRALGLKSSMVEAAKVIIIQIFLAGPFLLHDSKAYLSSAFDLSRVFLFKWTVNWRFVDEEMFLSKPFARTLLLLHASLITVWLAFRWTGIAKKGIRWLTIFSFDPKAHIATETEARIRQPSGRFIVLSLFTSNLIGITFARSLHYQFYSWYAQQIPLLIYLSKVPIPVKFILPIIIEWAWNTFPSTDRSSLLLFASHLLILMGLWLSAQDDETIDEVRQGDEALDAALLRKYESPSSRKRQE